MVLWSATPNMFDTTAKLSSEIPIPAQLEGPVILSMRRFGHPLDVQVPITWIGLDEFPFAPLGTNFMQEIRVVAAPKTGVKENIGAFAVGVAVYVISVALQEELAPLVDGLESGAPLPIIVIPILLGTAIPVAHVQRPGGSWMVSPLTAVWSGPLITALTSLNWQVAALMTGPLCAWAVGPKQTDKRQSGRNQFSIFDTMLSSPESDCVPTKLRYL